MLMMHLPAFTPPAAPTGEAQAAGGGPNGRVPVAAPVLQARAGGCLPAGGAADERQVGTAVHKYVCIPSVSFGGVVEEFFVR